MELQQQDGGEGGERREGRVKNCEEVKGGGERAEAEKGKGQAGEQYHLH